MEKLDRQLEPTDKTQFVSNSKNDTDTKLKYSLVTKNDTETSNDCIVYHVYKENKLYFYSLRDNQLKITLTGPTYNRDDTFQLTAFSTQLSKIPSTGYLIASNWFKYEENQVMNLIGVDIETQLHSSTESSSQFVNPTVLHTVEQTCLEPHVCEIATNRTRGLVATFTNSLQYTYYAWRVSERTFGSRLELLKRAKWTLDEKDETQKTILETTVESLSFDKFGESIATLYSNNRLQVTNVDRNEVECTYELPDIVLPGNGRNRGITRWTCGSDRRIITILKDMRYIYCGDIEKAALKSLSVEDERLRSLDVHPENENLICCGMSGGYLMQHDLRTDITKRETILIDKHISWNRELGNSKIQWNPEDTTKKLFLSDNVLSVFDTRKMKQPLLYIANLLSDACFL